VVSPQLRHQVESAIGSWERRHQIEEALCGLTTQLEQAASPLGQRLLGVATRGRPVPSLVLSEESP